MTRRVLGIKIDDVSVEEAIGVVSSWLKKNRSSEKINSLLTPKIIVTPGPEFLVTAQSDREFGNILNHSDLSVPDGFGLHLAGVRNRVPGVELMLRVCKLSADRGWTVGMIGNPNTNLAAEKLRQKFPGLKILYSLDNPQADDILRYYGILSADSDRVKVEPERLPPVDLLLVGVGHPKQEKLLFRLKKIRSSEDRIFIKFCVGMGVGGSFDFVSGRVWEPGGLLSRLGLKWLGRLATNPRHFSRVVKATVIFPLLILKERLGF